MTEKVAIVTGSNKGIGLEIVKGLCRRYGGVVYLTSRDEKRGRAAVKQLNSLGLKPEFHILEIDNADSVRTLRDFIAKKHGGIDLLVNNAAIYLDHEPLKSAAPKTVKTNFFGSLDVCTLLFPLLNKNARVVNVSSDMGHPTQIPSRKIRARFTDPELTEPNLVKLMNEYLRSVSNGTNIEDGWGGSSYAVSKVGLSALTRIQQKLADAELPERELFINHVHPGYVITDMTGNTGDLRVEEGAKAPLYLCLEPVGWKGEYVWYDCERKDWLSEESPYRT